MESYTPPELKSGVVHLDVTYWGRNKGLVLALDAKRGAVIYHKWIGHETKQDYIDALDCITASGYQVQAIVLDGGVGLGVLKQLYLVQMCQYHFIAIIRRKLTRRPKLQASIELLNIALSVTSSKRERRLY